VNALRDSSQRAAWEYARQSAEQQALSSPAPDVSALRDLTQRAAWEQARQTEQQRMLNSGAPNLANFLELSRRAAILAPNSGFYNAIPAQTPVPLPPL
jgi:hypothetical protein